MNIGIATFHGAYNFGASLQEYALFSTIERLGHTPYVLSIPMEEAHGNSNPQWSDYTRFDLGPYRYARRVTRVTIEFLLKLVKKDSFLAFEKSHLRISNLPEVPGAPRFDVLVCGSDQVWNSRFTAGDPRYFLQFESPETKARIAYAPSFGARDQVPESFLPTLSELLKNIDILSCREQEGSDLVEQLTQRPCPQIADPVMLLSIEDWKKLAKAPPTLPKKKFIFCYDMRRQPLLREAAQELAAKAGASVYILEGFLGKNGWRSPIGPEEFLWLIQHAESVVTNSFHGTVLSLLFQKPLRVVYPGTMITRIKEILERLHLTHLLVSTREDANRPAVWDVAATQILIEQERSRARDFLKHALDGRVAL